MSIQGPLPHSCFDVREDANYGNFLVGMKGYPDFPEQMLIFDFPASYHNRAATLSFVDGHSEVKNGNTPIPCRLLSKEDCFPNCRNAHDAEFSWQSGRPLVAGSQHPASLNRVGTSYRWLLQNLTFHSIVL